jgi:hypothetical protein
MIGPFIAVWRGTEDNFLVSRIEELSDNSPNTIVSAAAKSEGYSEKDVKELLDSGYELILCCPEPKYYVF